MKKIFIAVLGIFMGSAISAQTLNDAVRYSSLLPGGTARTMGAGGSFGAMGGDFGVLTINPAGLADFRSSDLSFSFSFNSGNTDALYNGITENTKHTNEPVLENIGIVFHSRPSGSLKTSNIAIGLNQYNNLRQKFDYSGDTFGSITDRFAELANGRTSDAFDLFEAGLAWEAGAIYDFDEDLIYETDLQNTDSVNKSQNVSRSGKINELVFAWAGKFSNNLNLGIGIGIPFISFEENKLYEESDPNSEVEFFDNLSFSEQLATSGTGFNFKVGLGYTVEQVIRLGLAYQSPTYFSLDDNYENNLSYSFTDSDGPQTITSRSPEGRFEYKLTTPSRLTGSIGTIVNMDKIKGFVNLDVQYVDYSSNNFNLTSNTNDPSEVNYERELNDEISGDLQSALNFNLGGEIAIEKVRFRAGLGLIGSPYTNSEEDFNKVYSLGTGFRGDRFYIDFAYQLRTFNETYTAYRVVNEVNNPTINVDSDAKKFIFTLGFKI